MKICVFAYGFPHRKSVEGINCLCAHGFRPSMVIAAPKVDLGLPPYHVPTGDKSYLIDTVVEAFRLQIRCEKFPHNESCDVLSEPGFDLGIVLGARLLSDEVIDKFKIGILNIHHGVLPLNRGLLTIERAVLNNWPQGCAAHLIDHNIDRGRMVKQRIVPVFRGDTWHSLRTRIDRCGHELMIKALNIMQSGETDFDPVEKGTIDFDYSEPTQRKALHRFEAYKRAWGVDEDY